MKATLEISMTTVNESNNRDHWRVRAKRIQNQRKAVALLWRSSLPLRRIRADIELNIAHKAIVTLTRVSPRPYDDDGWVSAAKGIRDQVADELGLRNDRDPRVAWLYRQERGKKPHECAVCIEVETIDDETLAEVTP